MNVSCEFGGDGGVDGVDEVGDEGYGEGGCGNEYSKDERLIYVERLILCWYFLREGANERISKSRKEVFPV